MTDSNKHQGLAYRGVKRNFCASPNKNKQDFFHPVDQQLCCVSKVSAIGNIIYKINGAPDDDWSGRCKKSSLSDVEHLLWAVSVRPHENMWFLNNANIGHTEHKKFQEVRLMINNQRRSYSDTSIGDLKERAHILTFSLTWQSLLNSSLDKWKVSWNV